MQDFLTAIGLMFAIEGLLFAAFPTLMRRAMATMALTPESFLRYSGIGSALIGVLVVFLSRSLS